MDIISRILKIIDHKNLNKSRFYRETGLSNGFLDKVKDIGVSKLEQILKTYPDINPIWLIQGKGSMIKKDNRDEILPNSDYSREENIYPLIDNLLDNTEILMNNESYRKYISAMSKRMDADEEKEKQKEAIKKLREIAFKKYEKK